MSWNKLKLKELGEILTGSTPNTADKENLGDYIPFIKPGDIESNGSLNYTNFGLSQIGYEKSRMIKKGSVLMVCIGATIGKVGFSDRDICTNQQINSINPNSDIDTKFLYYYMSTEDFKMRVIASSGQATMSIINKTKWSNLEVTYPPLPVQKQIVEKLDAAFADIDKAISATQKNIENAEALFHQSLNSFFNQKYNKKYSLGDVCEFIGGSQPPKSKFEKTKTKENIRLIQIRDYKSDKNIVYIPKELAKRHCAYDDVMIGRYGPPVFQILRGIEGSYNVALMKAVPNSDFLTKNYLFYFLKNPKIQNYIIFLSNRAAGQSGLNKQTIEPYPIYLPSIEEQELILLKVKSIEEFTLKLGTINQKKLSELNSLKSSILNQALSGELTKDAA